MYSMSCYYRAITTFYIIEISKYIKILLIFSFYIVDYPIIVQIQDIQQSLYSFV